MWIESKFIHILGNKLNGFKQLRDNLWNFRCPICGDSHKDTTKKRGYIYLNHKSNDYWFKCHNCGASSSFKNFIRNIDSELYKEFRMESFSPTEQKRIKKPPIIKNKTIKEKKVNPLLNKLINVNSLPKTHECVKYITDRKIPKNKWNGLYYCDKIKDVANLLEGYEEKVFNDSARLLLPFIRKDGLITHIQGRSISNKNKSSRYVTLEVVKGYPKIFGLDTIKENKPVYVVEGPIDSLFLDNCLGMGGSDVDVSELSPENTIFIFDNEPRSPIIINKMKTIIKKGFSVCIWGKNMKFKDINDFIINGYTQEYLKDYILNHTFKGLRALNKLNQFSI